MRFAVALTLVAIALAGCGSGFSCKDKLPCTNQPAPSSQDIAACNSALADSKCGSKYKSFAECEQQNAQCTPDGHFDAAATAEKCQDESQAYGACIIGG